METSTMIRQLRRTAKKHENDKLHTFDTNITIMCTDVANRLEKLEKEKEQIRAKTIDEFAERLKSDEFQKYNLDMVFETSRDLSYSNCVNAFCEYIDEIAEEMRCDK